jgi:hypothetical protein
MTEYAFAGYLILQDCETARLSIEYRRAFGPYCGVDRLPPLLPPDPVACPASGDAPVPDARLGAAVAEWLDSRFANTAFIPTRRQALPLLRAFQGHGLRFELVYCQLAWQPGEEERLNSYASTNDQVAAEAITYGFDVSWPTCNHSAILQPGVVPASAAWRAKLNRYGLLTNYEDAAALRREYLAVYPYPPFDIYVVHGMSLDQGL